MQKIIRLLQSQNVARAAEFMNAIDQAGICEGKSDAEKTAALVVAITAPAFSNLEAYTLARLAATDEQGRTFGDELTAMFEAVPHQLEVSQVSINQNQPWMRVSYFDGSMVEFEGPHFRPVGIRNDVIISGGTIAALCMAVDNKSHSLSVGC